MVAAGPRARRRDEEERIILMKSRDRRAEKMSEFVTNMFQYNVTVRNTRSEVIFVGVGVGESITFRGVPQGQ